MTKDDNDSTREKNEPSARKVILIEFCVVGFGVVFVAAWILVPFLFSVRAGIIASAIFGVFALLIVGIPLYCRWERKRVFGPREPMSNQMFLEEVGATKEQEDIGTAVREAFAVVCEIEPEKLYPGDECVWLGNMMPAPLDTQLIGMELETRLNISLSDELLNELFFAEMRLSHVFFRSPRFTELTVKSFTIDFLQAYKEGRHITKQTG